MTTKSNKSLVKRSITPEVLKRFEDSLKYNLLARDPKYITKMALQELDEFENEGRATITADTKIYSALTLFGFENGLLVSEVTEERYHVFVANLSRELQNEFSCKSTSEKTLAEASALNYVRTFEVRRKITRYLSKNEITNMGVQYLGVLSKELDRAQRHYLASLQTLKMLRQPTLQLNLKANTAVVGQNQVVQSNNA